MDPSSNFDSDRRASRVRHIWGFTALGLSILLLAAMTANAIHAANLHENAERWQRHTLRVLLVSEKTRSAVNAALRGERGYLITRDPDFLKPFERARGEAPELVAELARLTADNARHKPAMGALERQLGEYLAFLNRMVTLANAGRTPEAIAAVKSGTGRREIEALLALLDRIENEEYRLLDERARVAAASAWAAKVANIALPALALIFLLTVGCAGYGASKARMRTLRAEAQLRRAATTDDLTGLLNRSAFMSALEVELARVSRSGAPLSIAIVDLDHFKRVNDRFGHLTGDLVLRRFAEVARETMRAADVIGRLGGEEFAVIMPDTDQAEAGIAGERLRQALAERHITAGGGPRVPVTASIGVARHAPAEGADDFMRRADEALYEAKNEGRNQTRLAA